MIWLPGVLSQGGNRVQWAKYEIGHTAVKGSTGTVTLQDHYTKQVSSNYNIVDGKFSLVSSTRTRMGDLVVGDYLVDIQKTSSNTATSGTTLYEVTEIAAKEWYGSEGNNVAALSVGDTVIGVTSCSVDRSTGKITLSGSYNSYTWSTSTPKLYSSDSGFDSYGLTGSPSKVYVLSMTAGKPYSREYNAVQESDNVITYQTYTLTTARGAFIETVTAAEGAYPDNGIQGDYWYVKYSDTPVTWERYAMTEGEVQGASVTQTATSTTYFYRATSYSRSGKTFTATGTRTRASSLAVNNYLIQNNGAFVSSTSMSGDTLFKITKKSGSSTVSLTFDTYTVGDVKGSYIDTVTSYNPYEFPDDGAQDGYWYVKV